MSLRSSRFLSIDRTLMVEYLMLSYPIIFSTLNVLALEAVNTVMISRIGIYQAAAAVLAHTLCNIFKKINSGISVSVSLLVARANCKKNYQRVAQILKHALLLSTCFSCIFCLIIIGLSFIMESVSRFPIIVSLGRSYLRIIALSLIPSAINNMIRRYLEGLSYGSIGLFLSFLTLVTNILFNALLIYGRGGFPMLGLQGAGIAIVLSETLTAGVGLFYLTCILQPHKFFFVKWPFSQLSWRYIRNILWASWLVGLQFGLEGAYLLLITIIVGWISIEAQAAHTILFNICQVFTIFSVGLGLSGSMLVAQQRGRENDYQVRKVALTACLMIGMGSIFIVFILLTISPYIVAFYKPVYDVKCLAHHLIKHLCLFQLFYSICYWGNGVLRGLNDKIPPFLFGLLTQILGIIGCYMLAIQYNWGIYGIWGILIMERMLMGLFLILRFGYKTKIY